MPSMYSAITDMQAKSTCIPHDQSQYMYKITLHASMHAYINLLIHYVILLYIEYTSMA